jgi:hypothetical protein
MIALGRDVAGRPEILRRDGRVAPFGADIAEAKS